MSPIPIILVTGFLGAGKTSLLNHLLALPSVRERRPALILNEFGDLGVDAQLLRDAPEKTAVFELNKGSVFCVCIKTDLVATLRKIAEETKPGLLVVEATGVAEPADLEALLDEPGLGDQFTVEANLCVVDAAAFLKQAPHLRAARRQVEHADGLIVNKRDLAPSSDLRTVDEVVRSLNPSAAVATTTRGQIPESFLQNVRHVRRDGEFATEPPPAFFSLSFQTKKPVDRETFFSVLKDMNSHILRLKGRIDFGEGPVFLEKAGGRIEESAPPNDRTGTAFVVVAWKTREANLRARFSASWGEDLPVEE